MKMTSRLIRGIRIPQYSTNRPLLARSCDVSSLRSRLSTTRLRTTHRPQDNLAYHVQGFSRISSCRWLTTQISSSEAAILDNHQIADASLYGTPIDSTTSKAAASRSENKPNQKKNDSNNKPRRRSSRAKGTSTEYNQWGYLRHQYSAASDLKIARRAFNSWKKKFFSATISSASSSVSSISPASADATTIPCDHDNVAETLLQYDESTSMRKIWEAIESEKRVEVWPVVILSIVRSNPEKATMALNATLNPLPPGYAINDMIAFCAKLAIQNESGTLLEKTAKMEELLDVALKMIEDVPPAQIPFRQRTFGLLARALPDEQAHELFRSLERTNRQLHLNTMLQFAAKLGASIKYKAVAFQILQQLVEDGHDMSSAQFSSVITTLLYRHPSDISTPPEGQLFVAKDALQHFVERGFTPNTITFTAFLDGLCHQSETDEAIRLALLFAESGVQLDKRAWSTIFRGAKRSANSSHVTRALDVAKVSSAPYRDVLNNALHSIFYCASMESRESRARRRSPPVLFKHMLQIYAKKFDLEPLQWWLPESLPLSLTEAARVSSEIGDERFQYEEGIVPAIDQLFSEGSSNKIQPSATTISIMLRAYVKSIHLPFELLAYYNFFKSRLEEKTGTTKAANSVDLIRSQGSLLHDTFIFAMTNKRGMSRSALSVFGDMLKDHLDEKSSDEASSTTAARAEPPAHPKPSIITFNMLVRGLFHQGETSLAEKLVQVMKEHGHEPNQVTWNTLINGYSGMQSIPRTVSTLQDMEAVGFEPDTYTFKAFGKLKDQNKAFTLMEDIIKKNQKKMAESVYE